MTTITITEGLSGDGIIGCPYVTNASRTVANLCAGCHTGVGCPTIIHPITTASDGAATDALVGCTSISFPTRILMGVEADGGVGCTAIMKIAGNLALTGALTDVVCTIVDTMNIPVDLSGATIEWTAYDRFGVAVHTKSTDDEFVIYFGDLDSNYLGKCVIHFLRTDAALLRDAFAVTHDLNVTLPDQERTQVLSGFLYLEMPTIIPPVNLTGGKGAPSRRTGGITAPKSLIGGFPSEVKRSW